jgi:hypothetical protein
LKQAQNKNGVFATKSVVCKSVNRGLKQTKDRQRF